MSTPGCPCCLLCHTELGSLEIECSQTTHYDCRKCSECHKDVNQEMVEAALTAQRLPIHTECEDRKKLTEFRNDELPLTQRHLDALNKYILARRPENDLTLESMYSLLRDLQQAAANVSIAIKRQKDKIHIADAEQYRAHVEIETENTKQAKRVEQDKKIRLQNERQNPQLRDRRKAVDGMIALGITREAAESMIPQVSEIKN